MAGRPGCPRHPLLDMRVHLGILREEHRLGGPPADRADDRPAARRRVWSHRVCGRPFLQPVNLPYPLPAKLDNGRWTMDDGTQVEHVRSLAGKRLTVFVHGTKVGTMMVGGLGKAHLNRSTELGQSVPQVSAGNRVNVRTKRQARWSRPASSWGSGFERGPNGQSTRRPPMRRPARFYQSAGGGAGAGRTRPRHRPRHLGDRRRVADESRPPRGARRRGAYSTVACPSTRLDRTPACVTDGRREVPDRAGW